MKKPWVIERITTPLWLQFGAGLTPRTPVWLQFGAGLTPITPVWLQFGAGLTPITPVWLQFGSGLTPAWRGAPVALLSDYYSYHDVLGATTPVVVGVFVLNLDSVF